ncbi:MAG TPA: GtrA family protein [Rudaea sp.]|uniref:GtrA family protein n=1 Tax=Rudaea sp. TaxID=2136325 RepID=UPI002F95E1C8
MAMRSFVMFCIGGVIGFIVDAGVLQILVTGFAWDRFSARLISFLFAATATWLFNRNYTFRGRRRHSRLGEWARYVLAMSGGFACNFAAYSALVLAFNVDRQWLVLAVAAGSVAGLGVNYFASRYWIYRKAHHPQAPAEPAPAAEQE